MSTVTVTLWQNKFLAGSRWAVATRASGAAPTRLGTPFVLQKTPGGTDDESFLRVATAAEIQTGGLVVNPLDYFYDSAAPTKFNAYAPSAGDYLRILAPPSEWNVATPYDVPISAVVVISGNKHLVLDTPFWFCVHGLAWEVYDATPTKLYDGVAGVTERRVTTSSPFLSDRYVGVFPTAADALDHVVATEILVSALRDSQVFALTDYTNYPPGNPITNTYDS